MHSIDYYDCSMATGIILGIYLRAAQVIYTNVLEDIGRIKRYHNMRPSAII
jgi:hypothetical protein